MINNSEIYISAANLLIQCCKMIMDRLNVTGYFDIPKSILIEHHKSVYKVKWK